MPKLAIVSRSGEEAVIDGEIDLSVMEIIRDAGFDELQALCGGSRSCATCHVYIDPAFITRLPEIDREEDELLDSSSHRTPGSRLSCQIRFTPELDGLRVTIAPED